MRDAFRQYYRWDAATIERLRSMWLAGSSGLEIARSLRLTRGQVIGKINRLGLMKSAERPVKPVKPKREGAWTRKPRAKRLPPPPVEEVAVDPVPFFSRSWSQCAWIDGDPKAGPFDAIKCCGRKTKPGSSWCGLHAARVFQSAPKRQDRATEAVG